MAKRAVCNKCGAEYADEDSIQMVRKWQKDGGYAPCPNLSCPGTLVIQPVYSIKGSFTRRQPDGTLVGLEFHGTIDSMTGDIKDVAGVVLEGEMHGNTGTTRVHLFLQ